MIMILSLSDIGLNANLSFMFEDPRPAPLITGDLC